jgi:hypothetical protein
MRIFGSILAFAVLLPLAQPVPANSQEAPVPPGVKVDLNEIHAADGGTRCGKYFISFPSLSRFGSSSITFNFIIPPAPGVTGKINVLQKMDIDKFRIVEDPSISVPTFMILKDRKTSPLFEISLPPQELKNSKCLRVGIPA